MSDGTTLLILLSLSLASLPSDPEGQKRREAPEAPGVRIERAHPSPEERARRESLRRWRPIYASRLVPARRALADVLRELEGSSLASLRDHCREVRRQAEAIDREALFPSGDVHLDRVLYGALERLRAFGVECLADRLLPSYRLLVEAHAGLEWVDRRLAVVLRPPVRLPGLPGEPEDEHR